MGKMINRRDFLVSGSAAAVALAMTALTGCGSSSSSSSSSASATAASSQAAGSTPEKLVFAWEPGASEGKYENMRNLISDAVSKGAGVPCEAMTTTDYNVCIEAVNSGQAHYASLGAKEYVELHKKNPKIEVAWVVSDSEGKLNKVSYHSQLVVLEKNANKYKRNGKYTVKAEDIKGKNISWVELSSTSGYVIPSIVLAKKFGINADDLGESGKYAKTVLFGGSHVNSMYNILDGDADICAIDDTGSANNYTVVEGELGKVGAVYQIKEGLEAPLDQYAGEKLRVVASYPVPAVPFVVNTDYVPDDMNKKVVEYMGSKEVYDNTQLFVTEGDETTVSKWDKGQRFIKATDSYYDDFRKLIGEA
ncbi:MAG: PhnD/SsuA/transferrin family substrate-binding protein [Coriobacteriales bacterium]|jgi:phosphonate transport system substrate-binding protein